MGPRIEARTAMGEETIFSLELPGEISGTYPLPDGRQVGVTFNWKYNPLRVDLDLRDFPELYTSGRSRSTQRRLGVGYDGHAINSSANGSFVRFDLGRTITPTTRRPIGGGQL